MMSSSRIPSLAAVASSAANGCAGLPVRRKVFSTSSLVISFPLTTAQALADTGGAAGAVDRQAVARQTADSAAVTERRLIRLMTL